MLANGSKADAVAREWLLRGKALQSRRRIKVAKRNRLADLLDGSVWTGPCTGALRRVAKVRGPATGAVADKILPSCHSPSLAGPADLLPGDGKPPMPAAERDGHIQPADRYQSAVCASPASVETSGAQTSLGGALEEVTTQSG